MSQHSTGRTPPSPAAGSNAAGLHSRPRRTRRQLRFQPLHADRGSTFYPSRSGDGFCGFYAAFSSVELTRQRRRNESDGVFREDPGGRSVRGWEYTSVRPDRTGGHEVQEGDRKGKPCPGTCFSNVSLWSSALHPHWSLNMALLSGEETGREWAEESQWLPLEPEPLGTCSPPDGGTVEGTFHCHFRGDAQQ